LAVLPLGKVFYTNLTGELVRYKPSAIAFVGEEIYDRAR
jgi:hypothetical protein